ncbi:hypothetical protein RCH09_003814 [Actimicrobium sp. GrIS 1.19]|uniref:DUF3761 domain-containing protein n=1 Tax=Actimicrobium sp. GrIS 1.19 TaxID=3071708 RepID=UPI002DFBDA2D|nr:hypothetical protein [Actimicrobium sp. GrIS 1.19]
MKTLFIVASVVTALLTSVVAFAQSPADAPAGSTAECKDGTYFSGATKSGACSGHKGVKEWYGTKSAASVATSPIAPATSVPAAPSATLASPATPATANKVAPAPSVATTATTKATTPVTAKAPAAGGGTGQVWVNSGTKVYHCENTKYYGKTKAGSYMPEADAKSKGFHGDHGKACS